MSKEIDKAQDCKVAVFEDGPADVPPGDRGGLFPGECYPVTDLADNPRPGGSVGFCRPCKEKPSYTIDEINDFILPNQTLHTFYWDELCDLDDVEDIDGPPSPVGSGNVD